MASTRSDILETLSRLPHFRGVDPAVVGRIAAASRLRRFETCEHFIREGAPCTSFFVVRTGAVTIFRATPDGRRHVLHRLRAGQSFAEAALLSLGHYPANAEVAETPTEVIEIAGDEFQKAFREDERVAGAMVGSLCGWILNLVERIDELTAVSARTRVARFLLRQPATEGSAGLEVELSLAKKELAAQLSITPETLSRVLKRFADQGVLATRGKTISLLDPDALLAISDADGPRGAPDPGA